MSDHLIRLLAVAGVSAIMLAAVGCTSSKVIVYHNPLNRGMERSLVVDTGLLNPGAEEHPHKVDLTHWYTRDSVSDKEMFTLLESYPKSDVDTLYHPSEYVGAAHPIYHLSGSSEGRIEKIFLSDDSTFVIEPMAYSFNRYEMEFMIPYRNEVGFKVGTIQLSWVDSLSRRNVVDRTPEARQLVRYSVLGGLMMFLIIGFQNGLF